MLDAQINKTNCDLGEVQMQNILDVCNKLDICGLKGGISFIGEGNIWINNTYEPAVSELAQYVLFKAMEQTAPGQLSVIGYDSDLSGVFAPFAMLSSGENKLLTLISNQNELMAYLDFIWHQIQATQHVIQGRTHSLLEFRRMVNRPVESYRLVVLSMDMGLVSNELRSKLSLLMRTGPAYGVSFLIISTTFMLIQTQSGKDFTLSVNAIAPNITVLEVSGNTVSEASNKNPVKLESLPAETIIAECEKYTERVRTAQLPVVLFSELHNMEQEWNRSSVDGLTFAIGKYGVNDVEITIGDEINQRHNMMITGAVGQGKSNLISAIIHSLCFRYSPKELRMYLLDFKEGVTFKPFSNIGQEDYLPHAVALGLESDANFGLAVLKTLFEEYQKRMKLLKSYNLKSIKEYRTKYPDAEMPRIVVVIDEFQMMFGEEGNIGQETADLLEKSVRLFRAAGIHFILASQTLNGNLTLAYKLDSIMAQIPIRVALKNSLSESHQILGLNNSAAAFLRPREAIVNLDYGEISQNKNTVIAFADEKILKNIRYRWWQNSHDSYPAPHVFENERRLTIARAINTILEMQTTTLPPAAILGEKISVNGDPVIIPFADEPGRNIAIIGSSDSEVNQAVGMMQSVALSLALQHKANSRFVFFDFGNEGVDLTNTYAEFANLMSTYGAQIETKRSEEFETVIKELIELPDNQKVYVFGISMDRWQYEQDPYGQGSPLKVFVETGPAKGKHFIGWWTKASSYSAQVSGFSNSDAFNSKVFLRIDERTVQSMTSPFTKWMAQENRGLISDPIEFADEMAFVPYVPVTEDISTIIEKFRR